VKLATLFALFAGFLVALPAAADVQRFAVIVGNNRGQSDDVQLRYAETDAAKVSAVLRDLGGFEPANMVLLRGEDADTVRRSLITFNDRVRIAQSLPGIELCFSFTTRVTPTRRRSGSGRRASSIGSAPSRSRKLTATPTTRHCARRAAPSPESSTRPFNSRCVGRNLSSSRVPAAIAATAGASSFLRA